MNDSLPNYFLLLNMIFFSLPLYFLLLHSFFSLCYMLSRRDNHNFEKRRGRTNLKINLKMHYTQISFIWIIEGRNKLSMAKKRFVEL